MQSIKQYQTNPYHVIGSEEIASLAGHGDERELLRRKEQKLIRDPYANIRDEEHSHQLSHPSQEE